MSETISTTHLPERPPSRPKSPVKHAVEFLYDLQKLRIATDARGQDGARTEALDDLDKAFFSKSSDGFEALEKEALKYVGARLKAVPIYEHWLKHQKGVGPTMAGVIVASFDVHRAQTASQFWAVAGLTPQSKREKGKRANFDPWLRGKMVKVLADSFIKCNSPWRKFYDDYKNRKKSQLVDVCMGCSGSGRTDDEAAAGAAAPRPLEGIEALIAEAIGDGFVTTEAIATALASTHGRDTVEKAVQRMLKGRKLRLRDKRLEIITDRGACTNCNGTGGPAPWGKNDGHRDAASRRYMVKMFLLELHKQWRTLEGLPLRPPYAEQYLGRVHHAAAE